MNTARNDFLIELGKLIEKYANPVIVGGRTPLDTLDIIGCLEVQILTLGQNVFMQAAQQAQLASQAARGKIQ